MKAPLLLALLPLAGALVAGCSSSDDAAAPALQLPPSIAFSLVGTTSASGGGAFAEPVCVEPDGDGKIPVRVALANWILRPPGACPVVDCGQLAIAVDGATVAVVAAPLVELSLSPGEHTIDAQVWPDGTTVAAAGTDGKPLRATVRVEVRDAGGCAPLADAGSDATPDDADAASDDADAASD
jgi:hypothetical protein